MSNKPKLAISPIPISLPDNVGSMTLNEIINDPNTEFLKKGNKISIKRATDIGIATLEIKQYDTGRKTITQTTIPMQTKKSDYIDDIIQMKQCGMSQKDIAFQLGISESYVTKLLKSLQ